VAEVALSALSAPGWAGRLHLRYRRAGARTVAHDRHEGPLRVLQPLYPEGPGICHHVLVHPPGGIVGGDRLDIEVQVGAGGHALVTTPGATRFYRSGGRPAAQHARLRLAAGARLEWLPLENIAYPGCEATNEVTFDLADGASLLGWDLLALGLPAAGADFDDGRFTQALAWSGRWLERGCLRAADRRLLLSPLGLGGRGVLGCAWLAFGGAADEASTAALVDAARAAIAASPLAGSAAATRPQPGLVVLRLLAGRTEPALALLAAVRAAWRQQAWGLAAAPPRIWRT
jgi:urease accessory protein